MEPSLKKSMLQALYNRHAEWATRFSFACARGCAACCTRSVTMTTLEGEAIIAYLDKSPPGEAGRQGLDAIGRLAPPAAAPTMTTNQFAALCLANREPAGEEPGWDFTPCPFLVRDCCSIYPVRPFGCRSLGSTTPCAQQGAATMPTLFFAVNTVFLQLIEHLDRHTGRWGNMLTVLQHLTGSGTSRPPGLLPLHPLPGFLLQEDEREPVSRLLAELYRTGIGAASFGAILFGHGRRSGKAAD